MAVVKTTFIEAILDTFLPYYCRSCGKVGKVLCEDCKKRYTNSGIRDAKRELGEIEELFVVGRREGVLKTLVEDYKFKSKRGISRTLAELLDEALPEKLPKNTVLVPLPTIGRHVRERGFDHTLRLAKELGKLRGVPVEPVLMRVNKTVQVGTSGATRRAQAEKAYEVDLKRFEGEKTYLLLDDVWTTGASMRAAARKMRKAGATRILGAVVEVNCLD